MRLTLKHEDGKVAFEAEILKSPMGDEFDDAFFEDNILPEISDLEETHDSMDFVTDGDELLGFENHKPTKKLWEKLLKALIGLGFEFKV